MEELNRSIISQVGRLARQLRSLDCRRPHRRFAEVTTLQMQAIMHIKHHSDTKVSELATALAISDSAASLLADRLVAGGWVERVSDENDRRVVYLRLLPRLRRHFARGFDRQMSRVDELLNCLPEKDRQELLRILTKLEDLI